MLLHFDPETPRSPANNNIREYPPGFAPIPIVPRHRFDDREDGASR